MNKLLLLLLFFVGTDGLAQPADTLQKNRVEHQLISGDSRVEKPGKLNDSLLSTLPVSDSIAMNEQFERNINNILELQKDRRAKAKRNAMVRIGTGIAFLIILIIGLRRKKIKR